MVHVQHPPILLGMKIKLVAPPLNALVLCLGCMALIWLASLSMATEQTIRLP